MLCHFPASTSPSCLHCPPAKLIRPLNPAAATAVTFSGQTLEKVFRCSWPLSHRYLPGVCRPIKCFGFFVFSMYSFSFPLLSLQMCTMMFGSPNMLLGNKCAMFLSGGFMLETIHVIWIMCIQETGSLSTLQQKGKFITSNQ